MNSCATCMHIDKKRIAENNGHSILYGCNSPNRGGTVVGWVNVINDYPDDKHLKWMGGSCYEKQKKAEQLSLFN